MKTFTGFFFSLTEPNWAIFYDFQWAKFAFSHYSLSFCGQNLLDSVKGVVYMSNVAQQPLKPEKGIAEVIPIPLVRVLHSWLLYNLANYPFMHANFIQKPKHELLSPLAQSLSEAKLCNTPMTNLLWIKPRVIISACSPKVDFWGYSLNTLCQTWLFGYSCN